MIPAKLLCSPHAMQQEYTVLVQYNYMFSMCHTWRHLVIVSIPELVRVMVVFRVSVHI